MRFIHGFPPTDSAPSWSQNNFAISFFSLSSFSCPMIMTMMRRSWDTGICHLKRYLCSLGNEVGGFPYLPKRNWVTDSELGEQGSPDYYLYSKPRISDNMWSFSLCWPHCPWGFPVWHETQAYGAEEGKGLMGTEALVWKLRYDPALQLWSGSSNSLLNALLVK